VIILNPKLLVLVALIVGGAYLTTRSAEDVKEWKVTAKADEIIESKAAQLPAEDAASRQKAQASLQFTKDVVDNTAPPPPPPKPLTVENLIAEVDRVSNMTPSYVPTVPLMGRLATAMVKEDPNFITFGDLEPGTKGVFISGPNHPPKIVLSNDLKRMSDKGVPIAAIAPVLAHELDHFFWYLTKDISLAKTHDVERQAMVSTAAYIEVMKHGGPKGYTGAKKNSKDGDAVDARQEDAETAAYMKFLKKIRASLFGGNVDGLVKEHYGTGEKR
jgi:hypothetical protein